MSTREIPVEDEEGNLLFIDSESIVEIKGTNGTEPDSIVTYYVVGGKRYWDVHTEKAQQQKVEWLQKELFKK